MFTNPKLYEINTRIWIKRFGSNITLSQVSQNVFKELLDKGINIIWLMGIWKTCPSTIEKCCFESELITSYNRSLKDWSKADVIGSPYSVDEYEVNPSLGTWEELKELKNYLNSIGIKLFVDFVSNHFSADSKYIRTNPEIFLKADEEIFQGDSFTFFKPDADPKNVYAHGRDPFFPAWTDTIQINFFSSEARKFMTDKLMRLADVCDGVRCDMAVLPLNNVFQNTWLGVLNKFGFIRPETEFWRDAIAEVKRKNAEFIFLAEAYWDLEWNLQQLGFDFTYDKRLTDRLAANALSSVRAHLQAEKSFQLKSVRFLENHDEQRAIIKFGKHRSQAAATVVDTIQGMKFYYDGQFEGKKNKLAVQLGREPEESVCIGIKNFYDKLLSITKDEIFQKGEWNTMQPLSIGNGNTSFENFFAWQWILNEERRIIVINYSYSTSQCRLKLDIKHDKKKITLVDLLTDELYERWVDEINNVGLYIELKGHQSHIFSILT
jgi:glycosidase